MDRDAFSRAERRTLRELAAEAWERELGSALEQLEGAFAAWRAGARSAHEVGDQIRRFHNGVARDLYVLYTSDPASHLVARAVAMGLIDEAELPAPLRDRLATAIARYRAGESSRGRDDDEPDSSARVTS
jgi:hypothetical protein